MPLTGYQDWQRVNYVNGYQILNFNVAVTVQRIDGPFNVQAWNSLLVNLLAPGGADHYQVLFGWYADVAGSIAVASNFIVVGPNSLASMSIPVQAPYLFIFTTPKVGGNAALCNFWFYGQSGVPRALEIATYSSPFLVSNHAYAISATETDDITAIYNGNAHIHMRTSTNNPATVNVQYWDWGTAAFITYLALDSATTIGEIKQTIPMMASPTRILIANGAIAQSILCSLVPSY